MSKHQFPIGVIGLAVVFLFGYHALYTRQQEQVRVIHQRLAEAQAVQGMQADVAVLLRQIESSRRRLLPEPDPSLLAREVTALAEQSDVHVTAIAQESPQEFPHATRVAVSLQFNASYHQLGAFLDSLERSPLFIRTEEVDVSPVGDPASKEAPSVRILVSTLYIPPLAPTS